MEVPGIRRVRSRSIRGAAEISAQFDPATDMVVALQQVQNRVAETRGELPADTELTVERLTPAVFPVFILSLTGSLPTPDLNDYALYVMRPALARVPGAGHDRGARQRHARNRGRARSAEADCRRTDRHRRRRHAEERRTSCCRSGRFAESGQQHLALASGLWTSVDQIAAGARHREGRRDHSRRRSRHGRRRERPIARCSSPATAATRSRSASRSRSAPTSSTLKARHRADARRPRARAARRAARSPRSTTSPSSSRSAIANVRDAILIGGLLAVVVLIVFLRDVRLTLIAAVTLPLAVIPTFVFMRVFGGSINLMSMGGLAVAIGLVIDDAVVVVENIHRRASEGAGQRRRRGAAADGAAGQLHADDGRRVRAARAAVGRRRPVLPRAVA